MATSLSTSALPPKTWFFGPIRAHNPNSISIGAAVFAEMTAVQSVPMLYNVTPHPHSKMPLPIGRSGPHLIHGSLGPPESTTQMASRLVQAFLQGSLVWQTDWPTDRQTDHGFFYLSSIFFFYSPNLSGRRLGTIAQLCRTISSQLRHV